MRAVILDAPRSARACEVAEPRPGPGEVVVRVRACGVCGSDLNAWRGVTGIEYPRPPGAPGHEVWGSVESLGTDVNGLHVGEHVTGLMWNGFAELALARSEHLVRSDEFLLGEPLACATNVVRRARVEAGERVAIVGFGYLAALVAQLLAPSTGGWVAISRRPDSRALALRLGAEAACDFGQAPSTWWDSFPVVIETAGVQQSIDFGSWLVAFGGRLVIAGYHADGPRTINMQTWNWKGIDAINAHEREPRIYLDALQDVLDRRVKLVPLITHRWSLERIGEAFSCADERPAGFVKGIVEP